MTMDEEEQECEFVLLDISGRSGAGAELESVSVLVMVTLRRRSTEQSVLAQVQSHLISSSQLDIYSPTDLRVTHLPIS